MTDPLAWETVDEETAYACPGFDVIHERVELPDGTETEFDHVSEPPAVVIVPFTPEGEVVYIEEWRQAVTRINRGFPAGSMEPEEDRTAAARRELAEETGHEADRIDHLTTAEPANGLLDSTHHYFAAFDCVPTGEQDLDADESIRVGTTGFEAFKEEVASGGIRDGRTALGVLYYDAFGR